MSDEVRTEENEQDGEDDFLRRDDIGDEVALTRLLIIAPLLLPGLSAKQRYGQAREIVSQGWEHPFHGHRQLSIRTLYRWRAGWLDKQLDGLRPSYRHDRGSMRGVSAEVFRHAMALKKELPRRSMKRIIELLELRNLVKPGMLARSTLQRHLQRVGLTGRKLPLLDESVRRFEAKSPGDVWQSDEKYGPWLTVEGRSVRTRIFGFVDDHSRMCMGIEAFVEGNEINLHQCLRRALEMWHRPVLLYVDNGKVYAARQLRQICAELGIVLTHARPYQAQSKGKIERFWGTLDSFIVEANAARLTSILELNEALWGWVDLKYNQQPHSALPSCATPSQVYCQKLDTIPTVTPSDLDRAFRRLVTRHVHKDGTFSLSGQLFQVPQALAGHTIELRVNLKDETDVWLYRGKKRLMRAEPYNPPDKLPSRGPQSKKSGLKTAIESSRDYLASVSRQHRQQREYLIAPDIFTLEHLLTLLDLPPQGLRKEDRRAAEGIFDTFGPFDRQEAVSKIKKAISQWGNRRHFTVYLRLLVEEQCRTANQGGEQ
ncbi:DDE-type integrase/transposase/recombinase [candidate division CSSED10-310 bacterium]|uniref:DDE-type integrase/transposase/recombinase n=1 Tax=candidate division CSSED10-310 bacterium TaxID=2855610 RepID=A0ABV6Z578_UNCC1